MALTRRRFATHAALSQLLEELALTSWHESISCSSDVNQFFAPIVANDYGVQAVQAGRIAADDEFLPAIHTVFNPRAAPCVLGIILKVSQTEQTA